MILGFEVRKGMEELTALLYAIEASSVASRRYFLKWTQTINNFPSAKLGTCNQESIFM